MNGKNKILSGFTLAEVLITLAIIGVVASLTIPGLIQSVQKDQYATKLKKNYSAISQAFNQLAKDAGGSIAYDTNFSSVTDDSSEDVNALNELATKLNFVKNCGSGTGCWYTSSIKWLGGSVWTSNLDSNWANNQAKAVLPDGTMIRVNIYGTSCGTTPNSGSAVGPLSSAVCGNILVDVNGASGPNQDGRDFFGFWITKIGVYPMGTYNDGDSCDVTSTTGATSDGCAAKVLKEGAMNY